MVPRFSLILFMLGSACFSSLIFAQARLSLQTKTKLEALVSEIDKTAHVGIQIQDFKTGQILFEKNAQKYFTPASTLKIATSAAALYALGSDYRYQTRFSLDQKGTLYIQLTGDPSLSSATFMQLIQSLPPKALSHFNGNIILEDSYFKKPYRAPGWIAESNNWYYQAPIHHIMFNENCIETTFTPSKTLGQPTQVQLTGPNKAHFKLIQPNIETVSLEQEEKACRLLIGQEKDQIYLSGCWPIGDKPVRLKFALEAPALLAEKLIRQAWPSNFKKIQHISLGQLPEKTNTVLVHQSKPLKDFLKIILQNSNNVYTESLLKTMGTQSAAGASFKSGIWVLKNLLSKATGWDLKSLPLFDGSGLSRYNLISPAQLNRILYVVSHDPNFGALFMEALAVSGQFGSLKSRLTAFDTQYKLSAKTGSLKGISGLSGFINQESKNPLIFTILSNHYIGAPNQIKALENQVAMLLIQDQKSILNYNETYD